MFESQESLELFAKEAMNRLSAQNKAAEINYDEDKDYYASFKNDNEETNVSNELLTDFSEELENANEFIKNNNFEDNYEAIDIDHTGETLWDNGPTKSMLQMWKKQYDGHDILFVNVSDENFIIRTLNRHEYKSIVSLQNSNALNREEIICETVVLWPEIFTWKEMATKKAGIPSALAEVIMKKSGFTDEYIVEVL